MTLDTAVPAAGAPASPTPPPAPSPAAPAVPVTETPSVPSAPGAIDSAGAPGADGAGAAPVAAAATPGATPALVPAPAPVPSPSALDADLARALAEAGIDPESPAFASLPTEAVEALTRLGASAREAREQLLQARSTPAPAAQPPTQSATAHTAPTAVAPTAAPLPAAPSPSIEQEAMSLARQDPDAAEWIEEYNKVVLPRITALAKRDSQQRIVGGEIYDIDSEINDLQTTLRQADIAKKRGLDLPQFDEFQLNSIKQTIATLQTEKLIKIHEHNDLITRKRQLAGAFDERLAYHRDQLASASTSAEAEAAQDKQINDEAASFETQWTSSLTIQRKIHNIPEEDSAEIDAELRLRARASREPVMNVPRFINDNIKDILARDERRATRRLRTTAQHKQDDTTTMTRGSAPVGAEAVAAPTSGSTPSRPADWRDRLHEHVKRVDQGLV